METNQTLSRRLERRIEAASTIVSTVCFIGMVYVAVHIVFDPMGPLELNRYVQSHFTNFVDPTVRSIVSKAGDKGFVYRYTIGNGSWGFQEIRDVAIESGSIRNVSVSTNWSPAPVSFGPGKSGLRWKAGIGTAGDEDMGVPRGDTKALFALMSRDLPAIVQVHAGHSLHYDRRSGLTSDPTTPTGKRVVRWALGPRKIRPDAKSYSLLGELVPGVAMASQLGWIDDPELCEALARAISNAATLAKAGETERAIARLTRLLQVVEDNAGIQIHEEAYALIAFNVEYILKRLRTELFIAETINGIGESCAEGLEADGQECYADDSNAGDYEQQRIEPGVVSKAVEPPAVHQ